MERLGDDELSSIFERTHTQADRRFFSQVSKQFLKVASFHRWYLQTLFQGLLDIILPACPNLCFFQCSTPLPNKPMKLLAKSWPEIRKLKLGLEKNLVPHVVDSPEPGEFDFNDDGLCAVMNACSRLHEVELNRRLNVADIGVVSLVSLIKSLRYINLEGCVKVSDESLKAIGEATSLETLKLQGCYLITDLGLKYLANGDLIKSLKVIFLNECDKISDDGYNVLETNGWSSDPEFVKVWGQCHQNSQNPKHRDIGDVLVDQHNRHFIV